MPITRTPMVDDDGSGTTGTILNNAWKQELYNQIDAQALTLTPAVANWTPLDASGAGLTFTVVGAAYAVLGQLVFLWGHVVYPATADGNPAKIGNLPVYNAGLYCGMYQTYGPPTTFHLAAGQNFVQLLNPATMMTHTNAALSGASLVFNGIYVA